MHTQICREFNVRMWPVRQCTDQLQFPDVHLHKLNVIDSIFGHC